MSRARRTTGLAPGEAETLRQVYAFRNKLGTPFAHGVGEAGWLRPSDIGGHAHSHHSEMLGGLVARGLVTAAPWLSIHNRGQKSFAKMYRLSEQGRIAYELYAEHMAEMQAAQYWHQEKTQHRDRLAIDRDTSALVP